MYITCLDMEGVLVPEIWIAFAEASGIPELKRTTRDEPDYDKLMNWRLGILKEHGLGLKEIQETIAKIDPLPGAKEFLDELRSFSQVILISDGIYKGGFNANDDSQLSPATYPGSLTTKQENPCRIGYRHGGRANLLMLGGNVASSSHIRKCKATNGKWEADKLVCEY